MRLRAIRVSGDVGKRYGALAAILAALAALIGGCARVPLRVGESHPRPEVPQLASPETLALHLDPAIPDVFALPGGAFHSPAWEGFAVQCWRSTLTDGFRSGFFPSFLVPATRAERILEIQYAELRFDSTSWDQAPGETCSWASCIYARARVHFRARLVNASGRLLGHLEDDAVSRVRFREIDEAEATASASSAVEVMYERLAPALLSSAGGP